ncbi:hypothetical protein EES42_39170 [Streptomyces sp. ADI95-17]|nr:hypothetical protein EES42_39170 [Streptomyces sp. ADI95-17]
MREVGAVAHQFVAQVPGEDERGRIVEDQRCGQGEAGAAAEQVAQFHGGERVEAQVAEGAGGLYRVRGCVPEHGCGLPADQGQQDLLALSRGGAREPGAQRVGALLGRLRRGIGGRQGADLGEFADECGASARQERGGEARPVHVGDDDVGGALFDRLTQRGHGLLGRQRRQAASPDALGDHRVGGHAGPRPGTPANGRGGQAVGAAVGRERVEEGVARRVGALAGVAEGGGQRGEEDERGQVQVAGQFVEVECGVDLRPQDLLDLLRGHRGEHAVVEHSGRVHHRGQRLVGGQRRQQGGQRVAVGGVARGDGDLGAEPGQLGDQLGGAGGVVAAAADEDEAGGSVAGQPACGDGAERARSAGDQDGAGGLPRRPGDCRARGGPGEPAGMDSRGADGQLVLAVACGEDGAQATSRAGVQHVGQVDEASPACRFLGRHDLAEAPEHRLFRVGQRVGGAHGDRAAGGEPQGRGDLGVAQRLHQCEGTEQGFGAVRAAGGRARQGQDSGDRQGPARLVRSAQGVPEPLGERGPLVTSGPLFVSGRCAGCP